MPINSGAGILFAIKSEKGVEILLAKRNYNPCKNTWDLSGGGFEKNKDINLFSCAKRETEEEFCNNSLLLNSINNYIDEQNKENLKNKTMPVYKIRIPFIFSWDTYLLVLTKKPDNFPLLNHEFSEWSWYNIKNLPHNTHILIKHALRKFKKYLL